MKTLDVVALLEGIPGKRLGRGQVGTIVEELDDDTFLVEFSDRQGHLYATVPIKQIKLLELKYSRAS